MLRLNSTPMYGLSTRGHGPGYKDTALIEPLTRDSRPHLLDRTIFIERKDFEFENRYTFWTPAFREIKDLLCQILIISKIRILRVTARIMHSYDFMHLVSRSAAGSIRAEVGPIDYRFRFSGPAASLSTLVLGRRWYCERSRASRQSSSWGRWHFERYRGFEYKGRRDGSSEVC